ncbi:MAG TPA: isochorismate synthase [Limnochordales bacterium]
MTPQAAVAARPDTETLAQPAPRPEDGTRLVSLVAAAPAADPVRVFEEVLGQGRDAILWYLPAQGFALVGVGAVATLAAKGAGRFSHVAREWRVLAETALCLSWPGAISDPAGDEDRGENRGENHGGSHGKNHGETELLAASNGPAPGPLAMGGFAFAAGGHDGPWAPFGDARFWVPRWVYRLEGGRAWVHVQARAGIDDDLAAARRLAEAELAACQVGLASACAATGGPKAASAPAGWDTGPPAGAAGRLAIARRDVPAKEQWLAAVDAAVRAIRAGKLAKAVLARTVEVSTPGGFAPGPALRYLREHYPDCYIFAVAHGGRCFLGATPERLVRLHGGEVQVACLAGSIARGSTPDEDRRLGDALLGSAKNRHEHQLVLQAIRAALAPLCAEIEAPAEPGLLKFANVQHLYTPVRARLGAGAGIFDLAERLHPTPAMGGHPTDEALALIRELESADRGWYAGPVGWVDVRGEGEFAVAIRSALLAGERALLYAGCGIVADSDAESEFEESCLKLRPMLAALGANGG